MTIDSVTLTEIVAGHFRPNPPQRIGVAVSGGSDSTALMHVLADWCREHDITLEVITIDHGLRDAAACEAGRVACQAADLGLVHQTLCWVGWNGKGNLQDEARRARYQLITEWAKTRGLSHVALGHTLDDQAETFVMRLGRAAGVDGLAAMPARRWHNGITLVRPVLGVSRADLRSELERRDVGWIDDPTNDNMAYERVRVRKALVGLADLGIDAATLSTVADNMASARKALDWQSYIAAREVARIEFGDVVFDRKRWRVLHDEISRRLLRQALNWVSGAHYGARQTALAATLAAIKDGTGITLHGCQVVTDKTSIRIFREYSAVRMTTCGEGAYWDARWQVQGPWERGLHVGPLGDAPLRNIEGWRDMGRPRAAIAASPAIWRKTELIAAPHAMAASPWRAELANGAESFFTQLMP